MRLTIPPDCSEREFTHILSDYNGVLALDGALLLEAREPLLELSRGFSIHIVTADTFGTVESQVAGLPVELEILPPDVPQDQAKLSLLNRLGPEVTVALGNGRNDVLMLEAAGLGICVMGDEGAATEAMLKSDIVVKGIDHALGLLLNPKRIVATLRR